MQDAILASAVMLFIGFIMSLFIKSPPESIKKERAKK